jgi:hypothetical protein
VPRAAGGFETAYEAGVAVTRRLVEIARQNEVVEPENSTPASEPVPMAVHAYAPLRPGGLPVAMAVAASTLAADRVLPVVLASEGVIMATVVAVGGLQPMFM